MKYRKLGETGLDVSVIGLGCAQLGSSRTEYAVEIVRRAVALGVNYFDTARAYWDSEIKVGLALAENREAVVISSKTGASTKEEAAREIRESLQRLRTDYLDNYHLHGLRHGEDLETRLGPGGALEALIEAKEQGLIRHIGCTSHSCNTLLKALERFDFETILVPMNIVEREPMKALIPLCTHRGVGITIMKPVATGLLPAPLALKWLLRHPIATAVPGTTTLEEVEENALTGHAATFELTELETQRVSALARQLAHVRCRMCRDCEPCPQGITIASTLYTDVFYNHYRTMGADAFRAFPWSHERIRKHFDERVDKIAAIKTCTACGECEARCPAHLPVRRMLTDMVGPMEDMVEAWEELNLRP
jgi:predicted aldo/keto reductase-like oxidoreductase